MTGGDSHSPIDALRSDRALLFFAGSLLLAALAVAAVVTLTPAYGLPVGTAVAEGDSMGEEGEQAILYADTGEISAGDTIVFDSGSWGYIRHRVVSETEEGYVTQGDAEPHPDQYNPDAANAPHATAENTRGVVVAAVPLSLVQGGILGLLALLGMLGAALYRRQLHSVIVGARCSVSEQLLDTNNAVKSVFFALLMATSLVAMPFMGGIAPERQDHDGTASAKIENASLNTSTSISHATYGSPTGVVFSDDGTKMYVVHTDPAVVQYSLSTPWHINSASEEDSTTVGGVTNGYDIDFKDDGTRMYVVDNDGTVVQYDLGTAWEVSTASGAGSVSVASQTDNTRAVAFNDDGTKMYAGGWNSGAMHEYDLSAAWDVSTASYTGNAQAIEVGAPSGAAFNGNGTKMVMSDRDDQAFEYDLSTPYDLSTSSYSGNKLNMSVNDGIISGVDIGKEGDKTHFIGDGNEKVYEYDTTYEGYGVTVSGQVTDSDGNAIGSSMVTLEQDGTEVDSTSSDGSGNYDLSGVGDGDYTLVADADGYVSQSEPITVAGEPVTQNFTLDGNIGGQVVKEDGGTCGDCLVEVWMVNDANTTTDAGETVEEAQEDTLEDISRAVPRDVYEPDADPVGDVLQGGHDSEAVLVHSPDAWKSKVASVDLRGNWEYAIYSTGNSLETPTNQVEPGETFIYSCWVPRDGGVSGFGENAVDDSIDPGKTTSCNITVERIGPGNTSVRSHKVSTEEAYTTNIVGVNTKNHHAADLQLPEGYYRVRAEGSSVETVIRSGSPERLPRTIEHNLTDAEGNAADIAQQIQQKIDDGEFTRTTVKTDANGRFSHAVPDGYSTVSVTAFSGQGLLESYSDPTIADLRTEVERDDYNQSIYLSQKPAVTHPPDTDMEVVVREIESPTFEDIQSYLNRLQWMEDLINGEHYTDVEGLFTDAPGETTRDDVQDRVDAMEELIRQNGELLDRARDRDSNYDDVTRDPDGATESELREALNAQEAALEETQSSIDNLRDTITEMEEQPDGEPTLLNMEVPFKSNDLDAASTSVVVRWDNGSSTMMNESYWSVQSGSTSDPGGSAQYDYVVIEDYPLPEDRAVANIRILTSTEEGVGKRTERVTNPAFAGEVPQLESINVNTMRPGPSEKVTLDVDPEERSSYQTISSAEVYGPDGTQLTSAVSGDSLEFTANGTGNHLIRLNLQDTDGNVYTETLRVKAGAENAPMPPGVRIRQGITGTHAVTGDGLETARLRTDRASGKVSIGAVFPEGHQESELHVYTGDGLSAANGEFSIRALEGSEEKSTGPMEVVIHTSALSEGAHVYRNGKKPITDGDGTAAGRVTHDADGSRIQTYTDESGEVSVEYKNDPGVFDGIRWTALKTVPQLAELPGAMIHVPVQILGALGGAGSILSDVATVYGAVQPGLSGVYPGGEAA